MTADLSLVAAENKGKMHNSFQGLEEKSEKKVSIQNPYSNEKSFGMKRGNKTFLDEEDSSCHQQTYGGTNGAECCKQKGYERGRSLGTSGRKSKHG